jgi:hypothetical protein
MLDVFHYLFEDDTTVSSSEEHDSKNSVRTAVYKTVYNRDFAYAIKAQETKNFDEEPFDEFDNYVPPSTSTSTKPYMPPTNFNPDSEDPFAGVLKERPVG